MQRSLIALSACICSAIVILDQLSKAWVRDVIPSGTLVHIAGRLHLTHISNTGLVFGLGQGNILFPTIASILVLVAIPVAIWHAHREHGYSPSLLESICFGLIAGGAIGNLIDRITFGHVTDFLLVRLFGNTFWPAFNIADMSIVGGAILLVATVVHRDLRHARQRTTDS